MKFIKFIILFKKKRLIFILYDEILLYAVLTQLIAYLIYLIYLNINKENKTEEFIMQNENTSLKLTQYRGGECKPTIFTTKDALEMLQLLEFKYDTTINSCFHIYVVAVRNPNSLNLNPTVKINIQNFGRLVKTCLEFEKKAKLPVFLRLRSGLAEIVEKVGELIPTTGANISVLLVSFVSAIAGAMVSILYLWFFKPVMAEKRQTAVQIYLANFILNTVTAGVIAGIETMNNTIIPEASVLNKPIKFIIVSIIGSIYSTMVIGSKPIF